MSLSLLISTKNVRPAVMVSFGMPRNLFARKSALSLYCNTPSHLVTPLFLCPRRVVLKFTFRAFTVSTTSIYPWMLPSHIFSPSPESDRALCLEQPQQPSPNVPNTRTVGRFALATISCLFQVSKPTVSSEPKTFISSAGLQPTTLGALVSLPIKVSITGFAFLSSRYVSPLGYFPASLLFIFILPLC